MSEKKNDRVTFIENKLVKKIREKIEWHLLKINE